MGARAQLVEFYTTVKTAIWHHLSSRFEHIINDLHKERECLKSLSRIRNPTNATSSALTVAMPINVYMEPPENTTSSLPDNNTDSKSDSPWAENAGLLSDIIEQALDSGQPHDLKAALIDFDAPRLIATLVAGYLANALQINLTPLGVLECGELYSRAVVRVIVEKQLGGKGRLSDYKALIKCLARSQTNKAKVLYQLLNSLIKSGCSVMLGYKVD